MVCNGIVCIVCRKEILKRLGIPIIVGIGEHSQIHLLVDTKFGKNLLDSLALLVFGIYHGIATNHGVVLRGMSVVDSVTDSETNMSQLVVVLSRKVEQEELSVRMSVIRVGENI